MNNKTIIIANNKQTSKQLESWLLKKMPKLQLIGTARNTEEGLMILHQQQAQLVFVNLEDLTAEGFLQLKRIKNPAFSIIFISPSFMEGSDLLLRQIVNSSVRQVAGILLKINGVSKKIAVENIIRLEACSNYTQFYLNHTAKPVLTSKTLKHYVNELSSETFVRPHQSHLVNRSFIHRFVLKPKPYLILKEGCKIGVSRRRIAMFKN